MGYAFYTLEDGREAGYGVDALCDYFDCVTKISRGLDWLCGESPGLPTDDEYGCRLYFCGEHETCHNCTNPPCKAYSATGHEYCERPAGHEGLHEDSFSGKTFIFTEDDEYALCRA